MYLLFAYFSMTALEIRAIVSSSTHLPSCVLMNRAALQGHSTTINVEAASLHSGARVVSIGALEIREMAGSSTHILRSRTRTQLRPLAFHGALEFRTEASSKRLWKVWLLFGCSHNGPHSCRNRN